MTAAWTWRLAACAVCLSCAFVRAEVGAISEASPAGFSRPTVRGNAVQAEPFTHRLVYGDSLYAFQLRHYGGEGMHTPAFLILRKADSLWIEITHLSTEHARLGHSPDVRDIPLSVGWDFASLADSAYVVLPLRTSGSIVFPDRIAFDATQAIYRFDLNSELDRPECLTTFWVRQADLDSIGRGGSRDPELQVPCATDGVAPRHIP
ncbi:hypothetical protein JXA88_08140 [Candidatus Fermentibacteria bacterium]|nr:hypothetical protein [Candidatus Fermentibacteria bacterium]